MTAVFTSPVSHWLGTAAGALCLVVGSVAAVALFPGVAAADPVVTVTPAPSGGAYANGQTVSVSVGPNSLFTPHLRISILECADPGGTTANLPTSFSDCDENTIQADSVLVQPNGSFVEHAFTLYALPNATLGEKSTYTPVCDPTSKCVLYVGQNQDDFSQPKVFSAPFAFTAAALTPTSASASSPPSAAPTATATAPSAGPSAAVSLSPSTLAFTGGPDGAPWLVALGTGLVGGGILGRRTIRSRGTIRRRGR
jgi:hypothetical protein